LSNANAFTFDEKLAALVPQPRIQLTRYFGYLAPHSKIRSEIVPRKEPETDSTPATPAAAAPDKPQAVRRIGWAELLARVLLIDMKLCPKCGGDLKAIAAIRKILTHLGLPAEPPDIAPARLSPQLSFSSETQPTPEPCLRLDLPEI
jgi:hypothetical protein